MIDVDVPEDASDEEIIAAYEKIGMGRDYALAVISMRRNDIPFGE